MILGRFITCALGVVLAGLATPSLAAAPDRPAPTREVAPAERPGPQASHSRRVELPFLLESPSTDRAPPAPAPQRDSGPHPYRETLLKKAAFENSGGRLSRPAEFS